MAIPSTNSDASGRGQRHGVVLERRRAGLWAAVCAAIGLLLVPLTYAQPEPPAAARADAPKSDQPQMLVSFGWGGTMMPSERWSPVTVYVTTGEKPIAGTIVMEFPQDATQSASIAVPFAATPNRTTPVQIIASLPAMCDRVTFTMYNDRGRAVRSIKYTSMSTSITAQLPPRHDPERPLLVSVGRSTISDAVRDWAALQLDSRLQGRPGINGTSFSPRIEMAPGWADMAAARMFADELPIAWTAYDGVAALIVHAEGTSVTGRSADPRAISAVHDWVASGGRLVVVADTPGEMWREWLPEQARRALSMSPITTGPVPGVLGGVIDGVREMSREHARLAGLAGTEPVAAVEVPPVAVSAPQRPMSITPYGHDEGWRLRWPVEGNPESGLLVEGPSGYGFVVVLGIDPAKAPQVLSTRATAAVWLDALEHVLADRLLEAGEQNMRNRGWGAYYQPRSQRAASAAIERLGDVPVIGDWLFAAIAACIAVLAALVGPVDFFVLRRFKIGHRSWLTALVWIVVASVAAYGAPRLLRAAPTQINRLTVVDRMLPAAGFTGGGEASGQGAAPTYAAGMTGIYSGESGRARFAKPDPTSWWRGVSIDYPWAQQSVGSGAAVVPTVQSAAGGAAGSERGNPLEAVPMGLWTFRTFADVSRPTPGFGPEVTGITARIRQTPEGYSVFVAGLPSGVMVTQAALRTGLKWHNLTRPPPEKPKPKSQPIVPQRLPAEPEEVRNPPPRPVGTAGDTTWSAVFPDDYISAAAPAAWSNPPQDENTFYYPIQVAINRSPGPLLDIQGPLRRGLSVERRLESGRWAALYLNIERFPLDAALDWPSTSTHTCLVRLLVPLDSASGSTKGNESSNP